MILLQSIERLMPKSTMCVYVTRIERISLPINWTRASQQWFLSNCGHFLDWTLITVSVHNGVGQIHSSASTCSRPRCCVPANYSFVRHAIFVLSRTSSLTNGRTTWYTALKSPTNRRNWIGPWEDLTSLWQTQSSDFKTYLLNWP